MKTLQMAQLVLVAVLFAPRAAFAQRTYPVELQIMPLTQSVRRHASTSLAAPQSTTGTLTGVEASLIGPSSGLGLFGRFLQGNLVGPKQRMVAEGGVAIGEQDFKIEFAYSERLYIPADSNVKFVRGGINVTEFLGSSGVAVRFRAGYYSALERFKKDKLGPDGWQGETSVSYTWDRLPVFAQLGYRIERFRSKGVDEEMSSLVLGGGIWLWSRK